MPKKRKSEEKNEEEVEEDEEEVDSLEEMFEEEEEIDFSRLNNFLGGLEIQNFSPSLEKINAPQRNPIRLETDLEDNSFSDSSSKKEDDSFNYNPTEKKSEDPKYVKSGGVIMGDMIPSREIENIGKENPFEKREIGFQNSLQMKNSSFENFEKYSPVRKTDTTKIGKENPFERKEVKYSPEKD